MSSINKLLIGVFIFLTILIVVEVGFYFFVQSQLQIISNQTGTNTQQSLPSNNMASVQSFNMNSYEYWLKNKKPVLGLSVKIDQSEGKIVELDTKGGMMQIDNKNYPYALKITIEKNNSTYPFIFNSNDLTKLKIISQSQKQDTILKPEDLKIGDIINVKETANLLTPLTTLSEVIISIH